MIAKVEDEGRRWKTTEEEQRANPAFNFLTSATRMPASGSLLVMCRMPEESRIFVLLLAAWHFPSTHKEGKREKLQPPEFPSTKRSYLQSFITFLHNLIIPSQDFVEAPPESSANTYKMANKIWIEEMVLLLLDHIDANRGEAGSWMTDKKTALASATADINDQFPQSKLSERQVDLKVQDLCKKHNRRNAKQNTRELLISGRRALKQSYLESLTKKQPGIGPSAAKRPPKRRAGAGEIPGDESE